MPCTPDVAQAGDLSEIVFHLQPVNLEAINGFDLRRPGNALEPGRRTPPVLVGHQDLSRAQHAVRSFSDLFSAIKQQFH